MEKTGINLLTFLSLIKKLQNKVNKQQKLKKNLTTTLWKSRQKRKKRVIKRQLNSFRISVNNVKAFCWLVIVFYAKTRLNWILQNKIEKNNYSSLKTNKAIKSQTRLKWYFIKKKKINTFFFVNLPIALNKKQKRNKKQKKQSKLNYNQWFYLPLYSFLNNKKFAVVTHNLYDSIPLNDFNTLVRTALSLFPFLKLNRVATRLVAALQLLFIFKDTTPLLVFIKTLFQSVHYASHNQYYVFVTYLLQYVVGPQLKVFSCLGIKALFRGKLGVGGNSRKSVQRIFYGVSASSSKFIKIHKTFTPIKTKTGVVGFWLFLTW